MDNEPVKISRYSDLQYTTEEQKIVDEWWEEYGNKIEGDKFSNALKVIQKELKEQQGEDSRYEKWKYTLSAFFAQAATESDPMPPCQERCDWLRNAGDKAAEEFLQLFIKMN